MTLFPLIQVPEENGQANTTLPLYREVAWDFERDIPKWRNGNPVWVTGAEAVATWVWNTLHYVRTSLDIFSWDWGNELQLLTGRPFSQTVKEAEAIRYVKDCLIINPYISDVRQIEVTFFDSTITIKCEVITIYGPFQLSLTQSEQNWSNEHPYVLAGEKTYLTASGSVYLCKKEAE